MDEVIRLERSLWEPDTRNDPARVDRLLHPQYREVGSSGRTWARAEILEPVGDFTAELSELEAHEIAPGVVLTSYVSVVDDLGDVEEIVEAPVKRTSVWLRVDDRWLLRHHQGTPG